MAETRVHEGRNIKRFREMMGIKQDALAWELGENWNQQRISLMEQQPVVDKDVLERVAEILKVPADALRNFSEEMAINIITSTVNNSAHDSAVMHNDNGSAGAVFNINPLEKWIEALDENKALYERMLKEKDDMIIRLEKLLENNT